MSLYSIYTNDAALHERDIDSEERAREIARVVSLVTDKRIYVVRQTGNAALDESIAFYEVGTRNDYSTMESDDDESIACYAIYPDIDDDAEIDYLANDYAGCIADTNDMRSAIEIARAVSACVQCCVYAVRQETDEHEYAVCAVFYRTREVSRETAQQIREERARYRETHEAQRDETIANTAYALVSDILCEDERTDALTLNESDTDEERARIVSLAIAEARRLRTLVSLDDAALRAALTSAHIANVRDARHSALEAIDDAMLHNAI